MAHSYDTTYGKAISAMKFMGASFSEESEISSYSNENDYSQSAESGECPSAPIKKPYMFTGNLPSPAIVKALNNKFISDMQNEVSGNAMMGRPELVCNTNDTSFIHDLPKLVNVGVCKKTLKIGNKQCGKAAYKCEMCSYHWGLWKREHPFMKAPSNY